MDFNANIIKLPSYLDKDDGTLRAAGYAASTTELSKGAPYILNAARDGLPGTQYGAPGEVWQGVADQDGLIVECKPCLDSQGFLRFAGGLPQAPDCRSDNEPLCNLPGTLEVELSGWAGNIYGIDLGLCNGRFALRKWEVGWSCFWVGGPSDMLVLQFWKMGSVYQQKVAWMFAFNTGGGQPILYWQPTAPQSVCTWPVNLPFVRNPSANLSGITAVGTFTIVSPPVNACEGVRFMEWDGTYCPVRPLTLRVRLSGFSSTNADPHYNLGDLNGEWPLNYWYGPAGTVGWAGGWTTGYLTRRDDPPGTGSTLYIWLGMTTAKVHYYRSISTYTLKGIARIYADPRYYAINGAPSTFPPCFDPRTGTLAMMETDRSLYNPPGPQEGDVIGTMEFVL